MRVFHSKTIGLAAILGAIALVATACGGGESTATPRAAATPTPAVATTTPTAVRAATPTAAPQATATVQPPRGTAPAPTATPAPRPTATPVVQATSTAVKAEAGAPDLPQAKRGGQLKRRTTLDPAHWGVPYSRSGDAFEPQQTMHDQLVQANPYKEGEVVPNLAESWSNSADGLSWTFKIRQGVKFHNGNPLTAEDVKFTYDEILKPHDGVPNTYAPTLGGLVSMTVPDAYTLILKLDGPNAAFMPGLANGRLMIISKARIAADGWEKNDRWPPVGTGPFMAKPGSYIRGISSEVFRNDNYYMKGRPFLDGIKFYIVPDAGTLFASFLTGQINFGVELNAIRLNEARSKLGDKVYIQRTGTSTWTSVEINAKRKPFDDIRVRQAIAYAADKLGAIEAIQQGFGVVGGYVTPGVGWGLSGEELKEFAGYVPDKNANLAKAKKLLAEAGYPNGFETTYFVRNHPAYIDVNTVVKAMLDEVGIKGKLQLVDSGIYFEDLNKPDAWLLAPQGHRHITTDPNSAYTSFFLCSAPRQLTGVCDKKMQDLYDAQNRELDPAKRQVAVKSLERYALGLYGNPVLYYALTAYARYANIKNHEYHVAQPQNLQMRDVWIE